MGKTTVIRKKQLAMRLKRGRVVYIEDTEVSTGKPPGSFVATAEHLLT
jgi:hypothetical protein